MALSTREMKTLLYAAPALMIMHAEANHIMAPILMSGLNALGMQRHLSQVVVYAPLKYQGLAVPNLYVEMGISACYLATSGNTPQLTNGKASLDEY
jgi:hypothetical protein